MIRSFLNTDRQAIADIWQKHWQVAGYPLNARSDRFELGLLCKPFLKESTCCLILDSQSKPAGFAVAFENRSYPGMGDGTMILNQLCIRPGPDEDFLAEQLLRHLLLQPNLHSKSRWIATSSPDHLGTLVGLEPGNGWSGVLTPDIRRRRWLEKAGFQTTSTYLNWQLDLLQFHPAMGRQHVLLRRQSMVTRALESEWNDTWQAVVLGHGETIGFHLIHQSKKTKAATAIFWRIAPPIPDTDGQLALLWMPEECDDPAQQEQMAFFLTEALQTLRNDQLRTIQTVLHDRAIARMVLLERLGFQQQASGVRMERVIE
ncbi:MAG: hypothetical protein ACK5PD_17095 [Pirellulaceae bacterium]|jgi:hypothetical protein